jgi:hypothetical protein
LPTKLEQQHLQQHQQHQVQQQQQPWWGVHSVPLPSAADDNTLKSTEDSASDQVATCLELDGDVTGDSELAAALAVIAAERGQARQPLGDCSTQGRTSSSSSSARLIQS